MTETEGYQAYTLSTAIKFHFSPGTYDFFNYQGKVKTSKDKFMLRNDKYHYYKLARKFNIDELKDFYVANYLHKPNIWVGELLDDESFTRYKEYIKINQSMAYHFQNDLDILFAEVTPNL